MANFLSEIAVRVRPLSPEDSLARAAEAVRTSPGGAAPVQVDGEIVGLLCAEDLAESIAEMDPVLACGALVSEVARCNPVPLRDDLTIREGLEQLRAEESPAAPVVDLLGRYVGMVSRGELLSALMGALRPPLVGGMATPFGVYLTDGTRRGGVGDLALVSTGLFLAFMQILGTWLGYRASVSAMMLLVRASPDWSARLLEGAPPIQPPFLIYGLFSLLLFALLFRLSWITGYHAAEHQVVHAIEQGDDLRAEVVKTKPRVHPRCGTNLLAAFIVFLILDRWSSSLAFIGALIGWRFFGSQLQRYVTTRPASPRELESGLFAGRQLLERYQSGIGICASGWRRIWNMGLLQVALGFTIVWTLMIIGKGYLSPSSLEATWIQYYLSG